VTVGFPGSVHDARVLRSTRFASSENRSAHFSDNEHLLGDAAFKIREIIVSPYKRPEANIPENQKFNFLLSSLRISSEHVIGMLKGRFQSLKELRVALRRPQHMHGAILNILACCAMHNLLIDIDDEWEISSDSCTHEAAEEDGTSYADDLLEEAGNDSERFREEVKSICLDFHNYAR